MKNSDLVLYGIIGLVIVLILWKAKDFLAGTTSDVEKLVASAVAAPGTAIAGIGGAIVTTGQGLAALPGQVASGIVTTGQGLAILPAGPQDTRPTFFNWLFGTGDKAGGYQ